MVLVRQPFGEPPERRDEAAAYKRSIDEAIASYTDQGREPSEHLLALRAAMEPVSDESECVAADPLPERAVPRRPGRPRKNPE